jgi:ADP-ribose pyrophosphatase YjhB (NUDIX family)
MGDVWALLDEVRAIAQTGLHYCDNEFDRERYERLMALAVQEYEDRTSLASDEIRARFERDIGYATAHVGADAAVFDDEGRILLAKRTDDLKWGLIAGWVDPNESPEQTVVRELTEEAGVDARVDRLVGVFFREARADEHPHSTVSVLYLCSMTGGTLRALPHEVLEVAFKHIDEIAADDWHHHHETLARAAERAR